jgi:plastocyanin
MIARCRARLPLVAFIGALGLAGCSGRSEPPAGPGDGGDVETVTITNFAFGPATVTVDRGTTVRWRNTTSTFHTVTPDGHTAFQEFQTNAEDQTFEVRFDQPGRYMFYCQPHRTLGMMGVIEVQ